jgi:single-strand DNA-binding protein
MADGLNRVVLYGNLGSDPELRMTKDNVGVLAMRIATTESWLDKETKEQRSRTEWHDCVLFGPRAEALSRFVRKGDGLLVEGSLRTTSYEKEGVTRWRTEVVVRDLYLGARARRPSSADAPRESSPRSEARREAAELPF